MIAIKRIVTAEIATEMIDVIVTDDETIVKKAENIVIRKKKDVVRDQDPENVIDVCLIDFSNSFYNFINFLDRRSHS